MKTILRSPFLASLVGAIAFLLLTGTLLTLDYFSQRNRRACATSDPAGKVLVGSVLRYQYAYHFENKRFIESMEQWDELDPDFTNQIRGLSSVPFEWQMFAKADGEYATASVFLQEEHRQVSRLRFYTGAISLKAEGYSSPFIYSGQPTDKINELSQIPPIIIIRDNNGGLQFECPENTREDC